MSNLLDLFDQTIFFGERATGATDLLHCVWVYNRTIDIEGLRQFHDHLQRGHLSRLIERSPLAFGRHRWVSADCSAELEVVGFARSRDDFDVWLNEQASTPVDSEHGPGWHLAVLPFTDGGAGVSLVISHCLTDGVGLCEALADAACGRDDTVSWPARGSRPRWRALREDACQTLRDAGSIGRAAVATARLARNRRHARLADTHATEPTRPPALGSATHDRITIPIATIFVDANDWDARAAALGGTSNALLVGLASRLALRVGRVAEDGSVLLTMPFSERATRDTRANAVTHINFAVDPVPVAKDLSATRTAIKQALIGREDAPDERRQLLPIVPLFPAWLFRRMVNLAAVSPFGVNSSNLGVVPSAAMRPDGTDADYFAMNCRYPGITQATLNRIGGRLQLLSGRARGRVFISVLAYQPGRANSDDELQRDLLSALGEFSLACTTWGREPSTERT